jgi:hypothetical protein
MKAFMLLVLSSYSICQKYDSIDLVNLSSVIASEAKQSLRFAKGLLRRPPEADSSQ